MTYISVTLGINKLTAFCHEYISINVVSSIFCVLY